MSNNGYISKKKKGSSLYEALHQEALEILQQLSGSIWTDYNEHDPGVTLLENISYAITEIAHKIALPVQDLLQSAKGTPLESGDNGLFTASDILTSNPLTFNDYQKIWIDQIANVKNVWIYPVDDYNKELNNIKGLLHVFVEKYDYHSNTEQEALENERIKTAIKTLYNDHRNLCESLYAIDIYNVLTLTMDLTITLLDLVDGEEILATIFHEVNNYLAPEVGHYSLSKLQDQHYAINEIFNGPQLSNGFIKNKDLRPAIQTIDVSELIKIIAKIPGIITINNLCLNYIDPKTKMKHTIKERFRIPKNTTTRVVFPVSNKNIIFINTGISFRPDLKETKKQLAFIQALDTSSFKAASNSFNELPIPKGNSQDIAYHYPIRKQLPEIYGVGDRGISGQATRMRQAQVKQLQGYLLPFDQLIINFLAQLNNIYTLYDVTHNKEASYFTNNLPDIAELAELLQPPSMSSSMNLDAIKNYWSKVTQDLNAFFDTHASDRLDKVADHLLARHGETFKTFTSLKINTSSYGAAISTSVFKKQLVTAKQTLIDKYNTISYDRSKSFNYFKAPLLHETKKAEVIPGVLKKIALFAGIMDFGIKSVTQAILDSGIHVYPQSLAIDLIVQEINTNTSEEQLAVIEIEEINVKETIKDNLYHTMHFIGDEVSLLPDVLKYGIIADNYTIKENTNAHGLCYIFYKKNDQKSHIVHIAKNKEQAIKTIKKTVDYLVELSQESEGFFLLEHTLLLPPYLGNYYGFEIDFTLLHPSLGITVIQHQQTSLAERDRTISRLIYALLEQELQFAIVPSHKETYCLELYDTHENILAISKQNYHEQDTLNKIIETFKNQDFCGLQEDLETITQCYVFYGNDRIDERFFSFRMSFVMPSWPVRFQNKNFRHSFENICYEEVPIHIIANTHWIDYKTMLLFETSYFKWLKTLQKEGSGKKRIYHAYQLILLIQKMNNQASSH